MTDITAYAPEESGSLGLATAPADQPVGATAPAGKTLKTERPRKSTYKIDKAEIANRVCDFYTNDHADRTWELEAHLQRTAKYRMWTEGKDWPWPDACFSMDTELLTEDGWKLVGDVVVGERVYTRSDNGKATYRPVVKAIKAIATEAIRFVGKSIDLLVTPNHRMVINDWAGRQHFVEAEKFLGLPNKAWSIPLASEWRGENPEKINGIDSAVYLRILGWYISEGSKNGSGTLGIAQSDVNPEKCAIIESDLANAGITWKRHASTYSLHSTSICAEAKQELRSFGLAEEKALPDHVLDLCPELLSQLLETMVLGDGHVRPRNGHTSYYTTSKVLADQVQIIAQRIGKRATITCKQNNGGTIRGRKINGALPIYFVSINEKKSIQVRKLRVEKVTLDAPVDFACVNVPPDHTLFVRRNGRAVWCGNSDAAIPDMMTHSLKVQDTLHNAVMTSRPSIIAKAINKALKPKEETVNNLLDYQFFVENKGEILVGEMGDQFVNAPSVVVFVPWIDEKRGVHDIRTLDMVPKGVWPEVYFQQMLNAAYPGKICRPKGNDDWSWEVCEDETKPSSAKSWFDVEFYTVGSGEDMRIEMDAYRMANVFNGPRPIIKDFEDIVAPARCSNLQIPSPSNPGGAAHVVMVDYPSIDEIKRLVKSGFYDLVDKKDMEKLGMSSMNPTDEQAEKEQKDAFQGVSPGVAANDEKSKDHRTLTRYTCFDIYDIDNDGVNEDVIWWVIKEEKILLRCRELTQVYPYKVPRRPFSEGCYLPVVGRRSGISLLEMMEGLHDVIKQFCDQTIDGGTIANVPFFFYRATSNMRPEIMRMSPGEGYPISDPKNDVMFPQFNNNGSAFGFNLVTMFGQWEEKLTNIGDLQLGRVPQGKSSALRTARGMNAVMGQGDARPERILRRFFMFIADIYQQMHELNQVFLPKDKQIRILGVKKAGDDPYVTIGNVDQIRGTFEFEFTANAMNTSKEAIQESLNDLMMKFINPIAIQLGVTTGDTIYQLFRDYAGAVGQDKDKYLNQPTPESNVPKMFAEEALTLILMGIHPEGRPAEEPQEHLQKIMDFANTPQFAHLTPPQVEIFKGYLVQLRQHIQAAMQQQQMMAAAQQFQQGSGQPGTPGPAGSAPINTANPTLSKNEMLDESMPSAGGGGNPTMQ